MLFQKKTKNSGSKGWGQEARVSSSLRFKVEKFIRLEVKLVWLD